MAPYIDLAPPPGCKILHMSLITIWPAGFPWSWKILESETILESHGLLFFQEVMEN